MATGAVDETLIVIVGPTASGKTSIAIELAEKYGGEIICADSRTVYKGMDIGTAKPTADEQKRVPHWGLDLVEPDERFTAANFKQYAVGKIADIRARGKVPFLVGGSGLYVDAVILDYHFGPPADSDLRQKLEALTIHELHHYCEKNYIQLPENRDNKRYVIRAIEQKSVNIIRRSQPIDNTIVVGITTDKHLLHARIVARAEHLFASGVVREATILGKKYGWNSEAMTGNIYPLVHAYLENDLSLDEIKNKFTTLDRRLAKRQMTWFRRNKFITWLPLEEVSDYLERRIATDRKA